ncbi:DNA-3-methyladenine glycosylase [Planctomonas sp. JC2975]|uniref:DNA-3-methyladenine glycosylase n=1 Tax=Planctomonas sp. JC2975 TaxID=2729626 RepID=UPI0014747B0A|nr:DNA-3-methyladenine glycosylase [Planctomonas sp. JC2975]NNC13396.1 DNA-3-methyladenine glycosylase [Planctomonas sp. JC2975]
MRSLTRSFFERVSLEVAPELLGALLRHTTPEGSVTLRITEVEAYLGDGTDPGSHAYRGRTPRNAVMFGAPGHIYTYFTYGMHTCANLVCSPEGVASAVLLRGAEVVDGVELARRRRERPTTRGSAVPDRDLARGPARLTVAAGIRLDENGADAFAPPFEVELPTQPVAPYATGPRTGVSGPGGDEAAFPWRFWIPGDPTVSPYKRHPRAISSSAAG